MSIHFDAQRAADISYSTSFHRKENDYNEKILYLDKTTFFSVMIMMIHFVSGQFSNYLHISSKLGYIFKFEMSSNFLDQYILLCFLCTHYRAN